MFPSKGSISRPTTKPYEYSQDALEIMGVHRCGGDKDNELAAFELREIQHSLAFEKEHSSCGWFDLVARKATTTELEHV